MTVLEIYDKIVWIVYGDTAPPTSVATKLQGERGYIDNAHRSIQKEWKYWFMHETATQALTSGTAAYTLPTDFNSLVSLTPYDASGIFSPIMLRITLKEALVSYPDPTATSTVPQSFTVYNTTYTVYPLPDDSTMSVSLQYYKFLPRLDDLADEDVLTIAGGDAIAYKVALELCLVLDYSDKIQSMASMYAEKLNDLKMMDWEHKMRGLQRTEDVSY